MHPAAEHSPLGKSSEYIATYTPSLLFPIPRTAKWAELGVTAQTLPWPVSYTHLRAHETS